MRGVWALLLVFATAPATAQGVAQARYADPTDRYDHGILGDAIEWGRLDLTGEDGRRIAVRLPQNRVFEDTAPRLADLDGDGKAEVIAVESDLAQGARLSVYGMDGLIAATEFYGRPYRWLAPLGAADLDGDGRAEIALVDRPHLARVLRVLRLEHGTLRQVASRDGLTNHRIGEADIGGGIRDCGRGPEIILADADWRQVMAVGLTETGLAPRALGPYRDRSSFARALDCATPD